MAFPHSFPFDPAYGCTLEGLLQVEAPPEPADFSAFWEKRRARAMEAEPRTKLRRSDYYRHPGHEVFNLSYRSVDGRKTRGWVTIPRTAPVSRVLVIGHGYGGAPGPVFDQPLQDAACIYPCFRGLGRSSGPPYSENPDFHVTHDLHSRDLYVLGGCVDDLWMAVTAALTLFPAAAGRIGYSGVSFSGGIGALALPWEPRIQRASFRVPTFGNHPLRLPLPTVGSTRGLASFVARHPHLMGNLSYFDAATASRHIRIPVHVAAALFDPAVAPPSQFSIYNALAGERSLFVLEAGHFEHPRQGTEEARLRAELESFFSQL